MFSFTFIKEASIVTEAIRQRDLNPVHDVNARQGKFHMALKHLALCQAHDIRLIEKGAEIHKEHNELWAEMYLLVMMTAKTQITKPDQQVKKRGVPT